MPIIQIKAPGGFVPASALSFGEADGEAIAVSSANPLPVALSASQSPARSTPLSGSATASGSAGPFVPDLDRPIFLTLSNGWSGTVQLLRSVDGGVTRVGLTLSDGTPKGSFQEAVNAAVATETVASATYYLAITLNAGTLTYRMEQ